MDDDKPYVIKNGETRKPAGLKNGGKGLPGGIYCVLPHPSNSDQAGSTYMFRLAHVQPKPSRLPLESWEWGQPTGIE